MKIVVSIALLLMIAGECYGQTYYVGLCPGPLQAYADLVKKVRDLPVTTEPADLEFIQKALRSWDNMAKLNRFLVEIRRPDKRQVWVWKKSGNGRPAVFGTTASLESTAGRGGGLTASAQPGDNQRCFFQDTTIVADTLRIRRGEFTDAQPLRLVIGGNVYTLPVNNGQWIINRQALTNVATGQYHAATVQLGAEIPTSLTLYLLTDAERAQLTESVRNWVAYEPATCNKLADRLVDYLAQNWGGKYCASPALYVNAQRTAMQQLLVRQRLTCSP